MPAGIRARRARLALVALLLTAGVLGRDSHDVTAQGAGPVAAFAFSEGSGTSAADASANGNHALLVGGAVWSASGRFGSAIGLDGQANSVQVLDSASLDLTTAMTLEAWVYPTATPTGRIVHKPSDTGVAYSLGFSSGSPRVQLKTSVGSYTLTSTLLVAPDEWTHLAVTYDSANVRLYVNGFEEETWAITGALVTSSAPLWIGSDGGSARFTGRIDELRVYDSARTLADVRSDLSLPVDPATPLQVAVHTPVAGALGVTNVPISATFTRAMDANTLTSATLTVQPAGGSPVATNPPGYDPGSRTVTVTPTSPLDFDTDYTVTVAAGSSGVRDAQGGELASPVIWTFRTRIGEPPPQDDPQLRLAWAFTEGSGTTTADGTGHGNTGTLLNGAAWASGRYGAGIAVDGTNDTVWTAPADSLDVTAEFTLEAWIYPTSAVPSGKILDKLAPSNSSYRLGLSSEGRPYVSFTTTSGQFSSFTSTRELSSQQWTHVAATYDGTAARLYVNGLEEGWWAASGTVKASSRPLSGGSGGTSFFTGVLDEVRVFGTARTAAEVVNDMTAPVEGPRPLRVTYHTPGPNAQGVRSTPITATFSGDVDEATITESTFVLRSGGSVIPAQVGDYDPATRRVALVPSSPLTPLTDYTVTVAGGPAGVLGTDQAQLASDVIWTFRTGTPDSAPRLLWRFNEGSGASAADASGNGNTGTLGPGAVWTTGKYGDGMLLDGSTDGVGAPAAESLDVSSAFTLEAWIYPTASTPTGRILQRRGTTTSPYELLLSSGKPRLQFVTGTDLRIVTAPNAVLPNEWTHVAATYDGASVRLYVNGGEVTSTAVTGAVPASTRPLWAGAAGSTAGMVGRIDELRVYARALSLSEILADRDDAGGVDTIPPQVTSKVPQAGAMGVDLTTNVTATFDEAVIGVSATTFELRDSAGVVAAGVTYDPATRRATLDPAAALASGVTYTATLVGGSADPGIRDLAGNPLATEAWTFTTADVIPPSVVTVSPAADARYVTLTTSLTAIFSEPMDATSVTQGFEVRDTRNTLLAGTVGYDPASRTVTFSPSSPLLPTRRYTATLKGGLSPSAVKDVAQNPLVQDSTWAFLTTVEPSRIAAGLTHSVTVDDEGQVWTWGSNAFGERGRVTGEPTLPGSVSGAGSAVAVAAGAFHTLALKADGSVLAWGRNAEGQLGIGNTTAQSAPVAIASLTNVITIAAGEAHSLALKSDGTVWASGTGPHFGASQSSPQVAPVQVLPLADVIAIAAGDDHSLALTADGSVWAWGENDRGQLGLGHSTSPQLTPVKIEALTGVVGIGAGSRHSLAILGTDLSLKVWGANTQGQLGDGGLADRSAPYALPGLTSVRMVDGAVSRTVAALLDGSIKVWGAGVTAQGGSSLLPIAAPGNPTGSQVATAGASHNLALSSDGVIWGWKDNGAGQVGDGTVAERLEAVRVTEPGLAWKAGTPRFDLAGGEYSATRSVTITTVTANPTIRYSTDGSDPATSPLTIASGGTVAILKTMTLKAIVASAPGVEPSNVATASYILLPDAPALTPGGGVYSSAQNVTMTAAQPLTTAIYYTTDGSEPTPDVGSTQRYAGTAVTVAANTTVKARAYRIEVLNGPPNPDWTPSPMTIATYMIAPPPLTPPTIEPATAAYTPPVSVTMSHPDQVAIRYTLDGTDPSIDSQLYPSQGLTITPPKIVKAKAFLSGLVSATTTTGYGVAVAAPLFDQFPGAYPSGTRIVVTAPTAGSVARYTLDGREPAPDDPAADPLQPIAVGNFTLKARAFLNGSEPSSVSEAVYTVTDAIGGLGAVAAGTHHAIALRPSGEVWAWGLNDFERRLATLYCYVNTVSGPFRGVKQEPWPVASEVAGIRQIASYDVGSIALTSTGSVLAWGKSLEGQRGHVPPSTFCPPQAEPDRPSARPVDDLEGVTAIAAGGLHLLALKSDGTLWGWGMNDVGQVGNGTRSTPGLPVQVRGLTSVTKIAAGQNHSLAVTADGSVWAWGQNDARQLGRGPELAFSATPIRVNGIQNPVVIAAGESSSFAILADGSLWTWGYVPIPLINDGSNSDRRDVPVRVPTLPRVHTVAVSGPATLAVDELGLVWAWGSNSRAALGDGTMTARYTPAVIQGLPAIRSVAARSGYALAVAEDGSVWSWGANTDSQTGDGSTADRLTPMQVLEPEFLGVQEIEGFGTLDPSKDTVRYYHTDAIGSVRVITQQDGQVLERHDYKPFGEELAPLPLPVTPRLFGGKEHDAESRLDYFGARHFSGVLGRFTQADDPGYSDPLRPQSLNSYVYASNNPLRYIDPDGHQVVDARDRAVFKMEIVSNAFEEIARRIFFGSIFNAMVSQRRGGHPPSLAPEPPTPNASCGSITVQGDVGSLSVQQPWSGRVHWGVTMDIRIIGAVIVRESFREAGAQRTTTNTSRPYFYPGTGGTTHGSRGHLQVGSQFSLTGIAIYPPELASGTLTCTVQ